MHNGNPRFERGQNIGQRHAIGIVKMRRQHGRIGHRRYGVHDCRHLARRAHPDRVCNINFITTQCQHALDHIGHRSRRDLALVRTAQRAADARAHAQASLFSRTGHRLETRNGFGNGAIDIALRKGFTGCAKNHHLVGAGGKRPFEPFQIRCKNGINGAWPALDGSHDLCAIGHLRHPLGRYE